MTEPDWALGWKILEQLKASLGPAQQPLLDAIADLLNKQDHSGFILLEYFFLQSDVLKFYTSLARRVYDYRDWIADKVEPEGEHFADVDKAYRDAFEEKVSPVEYRVEDIDAEYRRRFEILHKVSEEA